MCAVLGVEWRWWKCRAARRGGGYEAHSERRFIQPAGMLFASERLFLFVVGLGLSVSQSLARRIITEESVYEFLFCHLSASATSTGIWFMDTRLACDL